MIYDQLMKHTPKERDQLRHTIVLSAGETQRRRWAQSLNRERYYDRTKAKNLDQRAHERTLRGPR